VCVCKREKERERVGWVDCDLFYSEEVLVNYVAPSIIALLAVTFPPQIIAMKARSLIESQFLFGNPPHLSVQ